MRPECLQHFDQSCWNLMEQCWAAEPSSRPLLGYVQPQLEAIREKAFKQADQEGKSLSFSCNTPLFQTYNRTLDSVYNHYDLLQIREFY